MRIEGKIHAKAVVDVSQGMCLDVLGGGGGESFPVFLGETGRKLLGNFFSSKTVPVDLNKKFISKFNHSFTNRGCLHLYDFKEKRAHKARDMQFFLQAVQNEVFKVLKMFKNNMKHTHDILILSLLLVIIMVELLKVFTAVELHFLKSLLDVNCSDTAGSSSMRPIFDK